MTELGRFNQIVVRAAKPGWAYAPTSGLGAAKHGGRFNPKGVHALYCSLSFATCAREVRFTLNTDPYTFYFLQVTSDKIIDLTSDRVRRAMRIKWTDLSCPNWESEMHRGLVPDSHKLALRVLEDGYHGALVPSFAPGAQGNDVNLVLWRWSEKEVANDDPSLGAKVQVFSRDALPKDRSSWD